MSNKVIFYHLRDDSAGKGCSQGGLALTNIFSKSNFDKEKRPEGDKTIKSSTKWNRALFQTAHNLPSTEGMCETHPRRLK